MTKLEKFKSQLRRINKEMSELAQSRREVRKQIAEMNCPFTVGDTLVNKRGVKAVLASVSWWGSDSNYQMYGRKIKKDGEAYKLGMTMYASERWKVSDA